jgi:hypothetical protein
VREAQILCKPVVITRFATSSAQLNEGIDGIIVPLDNKGAAEGIFTFAIDKELQKSLISYMSTHDYGNEKEVEKIY